MRKTCCENDLSNFILPGSGPVSICGKWVSARVVFADIPKTYCHGNKNPRHPTCPTLRDAGQPGQSCPSLGNPTREAQLNLNRQPQDIRTTCNNVESRPRIFSFASRRRCTETQHLFKNAAAEKEQANQRIFLDSSGSPVVVWKPGPDFSLRRPPQLFPSRRLKFNLDLSFRQPPSICLFCHAGPGTGALLCSSPDCRFSVFQKFARGLPRLKQPACQVADATSRGSGDTILSPPRGTGSGRAGDRDRSD